MENITVGQIVAVVISLSAFVTALVYLSNVIKKAIDKAFEPVNKRINELEENQKKRMDEIDAHQCKNFLVRFLADVKEGRELDTVEEERAYEVYAHYTDDLHKNSYIHKRWEELMENKED